MYCADHTYCTLRLPVDTTAETIKLVAADKLKMRTNDELLLVEVKSNGERVTFKDNDISIPTALSLNGRIFVSPKDHLDALVCMNSTFYWSRVFDFKINFKAVRGRRRSKIESNLYLIDAETSKTDFLLNWAFSFYIFKNKTDYVI